MAAVLGDVLYWLAALIAGITIGVALYRWMYHAPGRPSRSLASRRDRRRHVAAGPGTAARARWQVGADHARSLHLRLTTLLVPVLGTTLDLTPRATAIRLRPLPTGGEPWQRSEERRRPGRRPSGSRRPGSPSPRRPERVASKSVASKTRRKLPNPYKPAMLSKAANENLASAKPYEPDVLKDEDATSD